MAGSSVPACGSSGKISRLLEQWLPPMTSGAILPRQAYASVTCRQRVGPTLMRISKEISGNAVRRDDPGRQGRGEFEWCDFRDGDPEPDDLVQRRIILQLDGVQIDTGCIFGRQGGKQRVRIVPGTSGRELYPNWQIATALLMPRQTRTEQHWGDGIPIMRASQYCITHINFGTVTLDENARAMLQVVSLEVANQYQQDTIAVPERFDDVLAVWAARHRFDDPLAGLIAQHENLVRSGSALGSEAHKIVDQLQAAAAMHSTDYGSPGNAPSADVLPALLRIARRVTDPAPRGQIEQIPPEEIQIRRREVKQWRHWAATRGAASARFRREVREAYRSTCVVCGLCLPTLGSDSNPGVDAAHILPWVQFDLDHVQNGLCLCKLHHWAFDDGLIEVGFNGTNYTVRIPHDAEDDMLDRPEFSIEFLRSTVGAIPDERLPENTSLWPNPELLSRLKAILT